MVKTLRITTIIIASGALVCIIFAGAKGMSPDKDIEKFLSVPGVAQKLQAGSTGLRAPDDKQETPLIRQAKAFALRIDPPPPPQPVAPKETVRAETRRPQVAVSAKFVLVGTSYHTGDEQSSWALINEVGKGWHWVRQGDKVGYLVVEKIGDGAVLIRDGSNTYELAAERNKKEDYVKSFTGTVESDKIIPDWQNAKKAVTQAESSGQSDVSSTETEQIASQVDPEVLKKELQQNKENIEWLEQVQKDPASLGVTAEEAKELEGLGEMLKTLETEIKTIEANGPNVTDKSGLARTEPNAANDVNPDTANSQKTKDANEKSNPDIDKSQFEQEKRPGNEDEEMRPPRRDRRRR